MLLERVYSPDVSLSAECDNFNALEVTQEIDDEDLSVQLSSNYSLTSCNESFSESFELSQESFVQELYLPEFPSNDQVEVTRVYNPLEMFPAEVNSIVFQFLSPKELLIASEVSKEWYDFIADSKKCMEKIKVKIACSRTHEIVEENILPLKMSIRKYENLELSTCAWCSDLALQAVGAHKGKWVTVKLLEVNFNTLEEALICFESIESSVEVLEMSEVVSNHSNFNVSKLRNFTFPNLKKFHAKTIQATFFLEVFNKISTLEEFVLCSHYQQVASLEVIMKLLQTNLNIKILEISESVVIQIMSHNAVKDLKFQLTQFSVNSTFLQQFKAQDNFVAFLNKQARTLTSLEINDWTDVEVIVTAFRLPKLKTFTLKGTGRALEHFNWNFVQIPISSSITTLSLHSPQTQLTLKSFTEATPNLTSLSTLYLDVFMLMHLAETCPQLASLSVGYLDILNLSNIKTPLNLQKLTVVFYTQSLEMLIRMKEEDQKSNFELLLQKLFY